MSQGKFGNNMNPKRTLIIIKEADYGSWVIPNGLVELLMIYSCRNPTSGVVYT